ncbi:hypothetical protein [Saccharospirillum impatiens]|uniref:hypothetical protein n=1 Tax=Saccharospirillum impatiens TaxID=169438 RepID=UPI00040C5A2C|nr:hypothetical protein [Saccharospirillum impatiens]
MSTRTVRYDECVISIATEAGVSVDTLMQHPENQALLEPRHRSGCLAPGDVLTLPEQQRGRPLALNEHTELPVRKPRFRLAVTLYQENQEPLANQEVRFVWPDGPSPLIGETDANGVIRFQLPLNCRAGLLAYEYDNAVTFQPITLGTLLPYETPTGKIQRLCALKGQAVTPNAVSVTAEQSEILVQAAAQDAGQEPGAFETLLKGKSDL